MTKRRALVVGLLVGLLLLGGGAGRLFYTGNEAQARTRMTCDKFMLHFVPPFSRTQTKFTMFLNSHPTAGEWIGFKPGWVLDYGSGAVTYYVDLSGKIVHVEPVNWMGLMETWEKDGK